MGTIAKIEGKLYGKLTVVSFSHVNAKRRMSIWNCICACGKECKVSLMELRTGDTISCRCYRKEVPKKIKHGLINHPLYQVWADLKRRCYYEMSANYKDYGGRGIRVCDEWRNNFISFYNWSLANGYKKGLQIDRYPNNDGHYEPNNCRFALPVENMGNRRCSIYIEIDGITKSPKEWGEQFMINPTCIANRCRKGLRGELAVYGIRKSNSFLNQIKTNR
jgi:hypothetical protein